MVLTNVNAVNDSFKDTDDNFVIFVNEITWRIQ